MTHHVLWVRSSGERPLNVPVHVFPTPSVLGNNSDGENVRAGTLRSVLALMMPCCETGRNAIPNPGGRSLVGSYGPEGKKRI